MKPQTTGSRAFTLTELVVLLGTLTLLALLILPVHASTKADAARIYCANNLKQVGMAFRNWAAKNAGRLPMRISNSEGGTAGNLANYSLIYSHFQVMSNELKTPKVVVCPADERSPRTNFFGPNVPSGDFRSNEATSYFLGYDADATMPRMFVSGDRNIGNGNPILNYGYAQLATVTYGARYGLGTNLPTTFGWSDKMHAKQGNVCLMDGSVQLFASARLRDQLRLTGDRMPSATAVVSAGGNNILFP